MANKLIGLIRYINLGTLNVSRDSSIIMDQ